ncbi:MAG TPA: hypothetical protein VGG11_01575 [Xanthobacteraceae bacterium]|jgi:hypothetical protein
MRGDSLIEGHRAPNFGFSGSSRSLHDAKLRHADAGGRPIANAEFCLAHGRSRIERDRAADIKVYDNREVHQFKRWDRGKPVHQTIELIAVLVTALPTGSELAIGAFVHPVLSKLRDGAHAEAAKPLARLLGKVMPFWYAVALL